MAYVVKFQVATGLFKSPIPYLTLFYYCTYCSVVFVLFSVKRDQYCSTEEYFDAVEKHLLVLYQPS